MSESKKRKYEQENRSFQSKWEENFAFIDNNGKPLCLICKTTVSNYKIGNLKRHYESSHPNFTAQYPLNSNLRTEKLNSLKCGLHKQQTLLSSFSNEADNVTEASFLISWNIARAKRPYGEGEFVKNIMEEVVKILNPQNAKLLKLIAQIPISRHTTERRITEISQDVEVKLKNDLQNCVAFSLALDESTDIKDLPQLAVFVRYVSSELVVKEEMLDLVALKELTRGIDIKNALDEILNNSGVPISKLISVATDGAPAMLGKNVGLIGLLKSDPRIPQFVPVHCIIHREHLVAKYLKFDDVMKTVLQIINYIRTSAKNHRQFKNFLEDLNDEELPNDVAFYCIVRWLSTYNVLNRFVELLDPIIVFLKEKDKSYPQLEDEGWLQDLMFLTDTMQHLQTLNLQLQGKGKLISDLSQTIFSFQKKLQLFQTDIKTKAFNHFPRLKRESFNFSNEKLNGYQEKLEGLLSDFKTRFDDLKNLKSTIAFYVNPFAIDVIQDGFAISDIILPERAVGEIELIEMQEDQALQMHHKSSASANEFWNLVPESKYPNLKKAVCRLISIFGTTYSCESLYSTMKFIKSKQRSQLTNQHLTELIRTALTNFKPDFKTLAKQMQTGKRNK